MKQKEYKDLTFVDDFMFCKILSTDTKLCKELLELILNIEIKKVELVDTQRSVNQTYDGKGVRFDVYVNDANNTIYDIEMQATKQKDLPKRTRYYQGMIDLNLIEKGAKYSKLKKTYIIFICLEDIFGKNLPIYVFSNRCEQDLSIELGDETTKVIINASGSRDKLSKEMCSFLDYLLGKEATSELTKKLQDSLKCAIEKKEWEVDYMTLAMKRLEWEEDAKIYGAIDMAKELGINNSVIISMLVKKFDLTKEEAEEAIKDFETEQ